VPAFTAVILISNVGSFSLHQFSFQDEENAKITIAPDHTVSDPEDLDSEDKMPKNTHVGSVASKTSS
jgi:hypothetical protein